MPLPGPHAARRRLQGGFLMMFCSGLGQTYCIALFAGYLTQELNLSDGQFGGLYTVATLASAALLVLVGRSADRWPTRWLGSAVLAGLGLAALGMSVVGSALALLPVLLGLRFFGQGMLTHTAMTATGRWFTHKRGRAVAIVSLGLPAAEALLPVAIVAGVALVGWRQTWMIAGALLLLVAVPLLVGLLLPGLAQVDSSTREPVAAGQSLQKRRDWTRAEVMRSGLFIALLAGMLAHPLIVTGVFFNQIGIVAAKDWQLAWWAASFPALAAAHVLSTLGYGWLVDRFGAARLLPVAVLPIGVGAVVLTQFATPAVLPVFMILVGVSQGGLTAVQGVLLPEIYGTRHLGGIRSLFVAAAVLATGIAPGLMGLLLDRGVSLDSQLLALGLYGVAAALGMVLLVPVLRRLAAGARVRA